MDILNHYGIKLSYGLQMKLNNCLVLPERGFADESGQFELKPEILEKSVTCKILQEMVNDLQSFVQPIISQLEFLVYFHVNNCEMFIEHLKSQVVKISANSDKPVETSDIMLTIPLFSTVQATINPDEKLQQVM